MSQGSNIPEGLITSARHGNCKSSLKVKCKAIGVRCRAPIFRLGKSRRKVIHLLLSEYHRFRFWACYGE